MQYGGSVNGIVRDTGLPKTQVQAFFDGYMARYKVLCEFQEHIRDCAESSLKPNGNVTPKGYPQMEGKWVSPTGRIYTFPTFDVQSSYLKKQGVYTQISGTTYKNYYSQGFATGDVVPAMLGYVFYKLKEKKLKKTLMITTVHDSIVLDIHKDELVEAIETIKPIVGNVRKMIKKLWNIETPIEFGYDIEVGNNWLEVMSYDKWREQSQ